MNYHYDGRIVKNKDLPPDELQAKAEDILLKFIEEVRKMPEKKLHIPIGGHGAELPKGMTYDIVQHAFEYLIMDWGIDIGLIEEEERIILRDFLFYYDEETEKSKCPKCGRLMVNSANEFCGVCEREESIDHFVEEWKKEQPEVDDETWKGVKALLNQCDDFREGEDGCYFARRDDAKSKEEERDIYICQKTGDECVLCGKVKQ